MRDENFAAVQPQHNHLSDKTRRRQLRSSLAIAATIVIVVAVVVGILCGALSGKGWRNRSPQPAETSTLSSDQASTNASPASAPPTRVSATTRTPTVKASNVVMAAIPAVTSKEAAASTPLAPSSSGALPRLKQTARPTSLADALVMQSGTSSNQSMAEAEAADGAEAIARGSDSTTCIADTASELQLAVDDDTCETILLLNNTKGAYDLEEEIVVNRHVVITGNPLTLPEINATNSVRAFNVTRGGYLEMRHVRVRQGGGRIRARYGFEGANPPQMVWELLGGSVYFGRGCRGGNFLGVFFVVTAIQWSDVNEAITAMRNLVGVRMFGGDILVMGGSVTFVNCHFFGAQILYPLTDVIVAGNTVLALAGTVTMVGVTITDFCMLLAGITIGATISVFAGTFTMIAGSFTSVLGVASGAGTGLEVFVGGGVAVLAGVTFNTAIGCLGSYGFGNFIVVAGVLVMTGITLDQAYGLIYAAGGGFYFAVGAGVLIQTGLAIAQTTGVGFNTHNGGLNFIGAGTAICTGLAQTLSSGNSGFAGQGQETYLGAGYLSRVGVTSSTSFGTNYVAGTGATWSVNAGMVVQDGCAAVSIEGVTFFAGLGTVGFVGAGAAILSSSPNLPYAGLAAGFTNYDYWINGDKDPETVFAPSFLPPSADELQAVARWTAPDDSLAAPSIIAYNLTVPPHDNLESWVPGHMLRAKEMMMDLKSKLKEKGVTNNPDGSAVPGVWVGSATQRCKLCNAGLAYGPGSGACQVSDTCTTNGDTAKEPDSSTTTNDDSSSNSSNTNTTDYRDTFVLSGSLALESSPDSYYPAPPLAVRTALQKLMTDGERNHTGLQVSVWDPSSPSGFIDSEHEDSNGGGGTSTVEYGVAVVATSKDEAGTVKDSLQDGSDVFKALVRHLNQDGYPVTSVSSTCCDTLHVPSYANTNFTQAKSSSKATAGLPGSAAISIVEQGHESVPVSSVARRHSYLIKISGFPPSLSLSVVLVGASQQTNWLVAQKPLGSTKTDDKGQAELAWKIPGALTLGTYYVRASPSSSRSSQSSAAEVLGMSPAFEVVQVARRRKLGPLHEIPH